MKAEELRIGNLVLCDRNRTVEFWGVTEGHNKFILNYQNASGIYYNEPEDVKPIPLTEEWLIKFGLIGLHHGTFLLGCYEFIYSNGVYEVWIMRGKIVTLKYVHQLQNFYFALTNEELKLK